MTLADFIHVPAALSLAVVCAILGVGVAASVWGGANATPPRSGEAERT